MAVYVDQALLTFRSMKMSHLVADTLEELHAMADQLGLRREWFQGDGSTPHYDVSKAKRSEAIRLGAVPVTRQELGLILRRLRLKENAQACALGEPPPAQAPATNEQREA